MMRSLFSTISLTVAFCTVTALTAQESINRMAMSEQSENVRPLVLNTSESKISLRSADSERFAPALEIKQVAGEITKPTLSAPILKTSGEVKEKAKTSSNNNENPNSSNTDSRANLPAVVSNTSPLVIMPQPTASAPVLPSTTFASEPLEKSMAQAADEIASQKEARRNRIYQHVKENDRKLASSESTNTESSSEPQIKQVPYAAPVAGHVASSTEITTNRPETVLVPTLENPEVFSTLRNNIPGNSSAPVISSEQAVAPVAASVATPYTENYQPNICNSLEYDGYTMERQGLGSRFYYSGWVSAGVTSNAMPPITTSAVSGDPSYPGNIDANNIQMNQLYAILGIEAERKNRVSFGARADLLFGTDYLLASSVGLESRNTRRTTAGGGPATSVYEASPRWNRTTEGGYPEYGLAMPQLYAEIYAPILAGLTVKMGHYYSPTGVESVASPENFFYSHSYSMLYGTPQTLTGVLATQKLNNNFSIIGGFDQGWNTWDSSTGDLSVLGGFLYENDCKNASLAFTLMSGDQVVANNPIQKGNMTNYSLVYKRQLNACWNFMLEHDLGCFTDGSAYIENYTVTRQNANWYSLAAYLTYNYSETLSFGSRFEWFQDDGNSRWLSYPALTKIEGLYDTRGENYYNLTFGANWRPTCRLTVRPEIRYDWANFERNWADGTRQYAYDSGAKKDLFTVGGDLLFQF